MMTMIVIIVTCTAAPRGTVTAARASFERLIIRFSEAVNRKAYILHNSPEIARACAAAQHV